MINFVALPLVATLLVVLIGGRLLDRLDPKAAARCSAVLLVVGTAATIPTLWLIGLSGLAHDGLQNPISDWSRHLFPHHFPHHRPAGGFIGLISALVAVIGLARVGRVLVRHLRLRCTDTEPIEFVESDEVYAYTLPGPAATIAISTGLRDALDDAEFAIVLAHEQAHAKHRHDRLKLLGLLCTAFVPPVRPLKQRLDFYLERWADEEALIATGVERKLAALTIAKVALSSVAPAHTLGIAGHSTAARADALLAPVENSSRSTRLSVAATIVVSLALGAYQLHHTAIFAISIAH